MEGRCRSVCSSTTAGQTAASFAFLNPSVCSARLAYSCRKIGAAWFLGEHVLTHSPRPGSRTAAQVSKLTIAAFPFQIAGITQRLKERRVSIHFNQLVPADIA